MPPPTETYQIGIPEKFRDEAALLYEEAFGPKFKVAIRSRKKRLQLLSESLQPAFCIGCISDGNLIGIAGFHSSEGAFTGGIDFSRLTRTLGFLNGVWAAGILSLYERKSCPNELLMDGIAVSARYRGRGIGSRLLTELESYAATNGFQSIRLDVIDINPRARHLYEKQGFAASSSESFEYLRWLLGFGGSTTLVKSM